MFTGRAKPIRIIGNPDNQRPDKWSSTVLWCCEQSWCASHLVVYLCTELRDGYAPCGHDVVVIISHRWRHQAHHMVRSVLKFATRWHWLNWPRLEALCFWVLCRYQGNPCRHIGRRTSVVTNRPQYVQILLICPSHRMALGHAAGLWSMGISR
jgi:hypothetical protein